MTHALSAPDVLEYMPAIHLQSSTDLAPCPGALTLEECKGQSAQFLSSCLYLPGKHAKQGELSEVLTEPGTHSQEPLPSVSLNVPKTHGVHFSPSGPVWPTSHWQSCARKKGSAYLPDILSQKQSYV